MEEQIGRDSRLDLRYVSGEMSKTAESVKADSYDLVFIDDSTYPEERAETIRMIANKGARLTVVVVHDFEVKLYRQAAALFDNRFRCTALNPNTGILWNHAHIKQGKLKLLNNIIRQHRDALAHDELSGWNNAFSDY
ncbi:MAG TPA: hypothetical protein VF553_04415 [Pyrinomonadaceae bacterium]